MSERVVVSCYRFLGVTSFVLKVRTWSDNKVPIYLYQMNVIFCHSYPVKRGQSQDITFTLKCPILDKQKQISFGSTFRASFPHSAQLSSLMEPDTQPNRSCLLRLSK